jgi:hypothetical protein
MFLRRAPERSKILLNLEGRRLTHNDWKLGDT